MSAPGLPAGREGWGQEGLAEELLALVPVVLWQGPAQVTGHWGPTGQRGRVGSCSAAGWGGILASHHGTGGADWEAGMHRGLYPGFCWISLESPGRMSRVGVPAWGGFQQAGAQQDCAGERGSLAVLVFQETAGCAGRAVPQLSGDSSTVTKWHLLSRKGQGRQLEPGPSLFTRV